MKKARSERTRERQENTTDISLILIVYILVLYLISSLLLSLTLTHPVVFIGIIPSPFIITLTSTTLITNRIRPRRISIVGEEELEQNA